MSNNLNIKLLILAIVILVSCNKSNYDYFGIYYFKKSNIVNSNIKINQDSTFIYYYLSGAEEKTVKGEWTFKNNALILNSYKSPIKDSILVEEIFIKTNDSISFIIRDFNNKALGGAAITFKEMPNFGVNLNKNGEISISNNISFREFTVHYLGHIYPYKVKNYKANLFRVKVYYPEPRDSYYRYFTNEKWELKYKKIIDPKFGIKYKK